MSFQPLFYLLGLGVLFPLLFLLLSPPLFPSMAPFFLLQILLLMLTTELFFVPLLQPPLPPDHIMPMFALLCQSLPLCFLYDLASIIFRPCHCLLALVPALFPLLTVAFFLPLNLYLRWNGRGLWM
ncbi:hypothetical protein B0T25DRAFT_517424 [Lasiosphaeria hispida]|uniref:Uncharacterized protein n=1 Tax=Lasiosphaeria hispida TaxID=260671 RepID=A0AAJ0HNH1_9PEZI|nr:hypothetical protein B0T25DRAFT_517424 [Lasiosphaeria hispida]